ncbi:hypothetical protein BDP55DRAFT_650941, partial [Colletotrichum godetiae]
MLPGRQASTLARPDRLCVNVCLGATLVRLVGAETVSLSRNFRCPRHGKRRTKPQGCGTSSSSARQRKAKTFGSWVAPLHVHFFQWGRTGNIFFFPFHELLFFSFHFEWREAGKNKTGFGCVCTNIIVWV